MDPLDFIEACDSCLEDIERLPDRANPGWVEGITELIEGMRSTATEKDFCTEKMEDALERVHSSVLRWFD